MEGLKSEAMDSKYEGKINPPKEPDMGVAKARMSRPTGPDRKEMAYNRRRSASEGRKIRWLWAAKPWYGRSYQGWLIL
jgi:hypothetical protein